MELLTTNARGRLRPLTAALVALGAACAHAPPPPPANAPSWPPTPATPLVRWAGTFPDARFTTPAPSAWSQIAAVLFGVEPEKADAAILRRPFGLAALEAGFAVADPDGQAVLRVDWRRGKADAVSCAGLPWRLPLAVAAGADGRLFVADAGGGVVVRVGDDGRCVRLGEGLLDRPSGLALAPGRLYVVDPPRHVVLVLSPDDGRELGRLDVAASEGPPLHYPTAVAVAPDGSVLVVDALNFRVARFNAQGGYVTGFGEAGDGDGAFGRPKAVAVDADGRLYVTDAQHDVVLLFSPGGTFLAAVGSAPGELGALALPAGVAVRDGYLYVANSYNQRVEIFVLVGQGSP